MRSGSAQRASATYTNTIPGQRWYAFLPWSDIRAHRRYESIWHEHTRLEVIDTYTTDIAKHFSGTSCPLSIPAFLPSPLLISKRVYYNTSENKNVVLGVKCRNRVRNVSFFCLFYHFLFVCLIQKHHKVKLIILIIDMHGSAVFLTCLADGTQAQAFFLSAPLR